MNEKGRIFLVSITILLVTSVVGPQLSARQGTTQNPWAVFGNDAAHTGFSTASPVTEDVVLGWTYAFDTGLSTYAQSPVVDHGNLYCVGPFAAPHLYCLDANQGTLQWSFTASGLAKGYSAPAVYNDQVFVAFHSDKLYCLDAGGNPDGTTTELWQYPTDEHDASVSFFSPVVVADGLVYLTTEDTLVCLDAEAGINEWTWTDETSLQQYSAPAVAQNKVIVVSHYGGPVSGRYVMIHCISTSTGVEQWSQTISVDDFSVSSSPTIAYNKIFVGSYCFDINTGMLLWSYGEIGDAGKSSPAAASGNVYVGLGTSLYCFDADPSEGVDEGVADDPTVDYDILWTYDTMEDMTVSSPVVTDEYVYITSYDGTLYCFDAAEGTLLWSYNTGESALLTSPVLSDEHLYLIGNTQALCLRNNHVPLTPAQPSATPKGVSPGYTFSAVTTDPDEDEVYYQFTWGDGTTSGWLGPYPSGDDVVTDHSWSTSGTYNVRVQAKDINGATSPWSTALQLTVDVDTSQPSLVLSFDSPVVEETEFVVTVTDDLGVPVQDVLVVFNTIQYFTDDQGQCTCTAPDVDEQPQMPITAGKNGYLSASETIIINPQVDTQQRGYCYGVVTDSLGTLLPDASICADTNTQRSCDTTDDTGQFLLELIPGTYQITVSKSGYYLKTKHLTIPANEAIEANFFLTAKEESSTSLDYFLEQYINDGFIGAFIQDQENVVVYNEALTVSVTSSSREVTCTVSASSDTPATILMFQLDEFNEKPFEVLYDGYPIPQNTDDEAFFSASTPTLQYHRDKGNLFVSIPHFSEHTITITSLVETFGGLLALLTYVGIAIVALVLFLTPHIKDIATRYIDIKKRK